MSDELILGFPLPENPKIWIDYQELLRREDHPFYQNFQEFDLYEVPGMYSGQREFKVGLKEWMKWTRKRNAQIRKIIKAKRTKI